MAEKKRARPDTLRTPASPKGVDQKFDTLRQLVHQRDSLIRGWSEIDQESANDRPPENPRGRRLG